MKKPQYIIALWSDKTFAYYNTVIGLPTFVPNISCAAKYDTMREANIHYWAIKSSLVAASEEDLVFLPFVYDMANFCMDETIAELANL